MKTVVTGGTGFIGSHLVKALLDANRDVVVAADFARLGMENLAELGIGAHTIKIRKTDLKEYSQALMAIKGADVVFHLAARVGSLKYLHETGLSELAALQENLLIDTNVYRACIETGVKRIVYASSCAVYPLRKQVTHGAVFSESDLILERSDYLNLIPAESQNSLMIDPDGGYGWAKLVGEIQLSLMQNIQIGIARIFNVYGQNEPLLKERHVVADLCWKAAQYPKIKFDVWGNGTQTRDFLYVSDCASALLSLEEKVSHSDGPVTVNIGSEDAVPINDVAKVIVQVSRKDIKIQHDPRKPVGPFSRSADMRVSRSLLNWQPKVNLEEGLKRTYFWVERKLSAQQVS